MSSILTNTSAMTALSTLRSINSNLNETQNRISSGLKISSGKDNAAYFAISETMKGDSGMYKAIDESLSQTKNSISTARLGAETVADLGAQFAERVAFAQNGTDEDKQTVQKELTDLVSQMTTTIDQSSFNGQTLVKGTATENVVTGISRDGAGNITTTTVSFNQQDLVAIKDAFAAIDVTAAEDFGADGIAGTADDVDTMATRLAAAETALGNAINSANELGIAEKSIETQRNFLAELSDRLDSGVGSMVDANMEEEAARLQSLQVQQQLATQSLSIANQAPQSILSLFR